MLRLRRPQLPHSREAVVLARAAAAVRITVLQRQAGCSPTLGLLGLLVQLREQAHIQPIPMDLRTVRTVGHPTHRLGLGTLAPLGLVPRPLSFRALLVTTRTGQRPLGNGTPARPLHKDRAAAAAHRQLQQEAQHSIPALPLEAPVGPLGSGPLCEGTLG